MLANLEAEIEAAWALTLKAAWLISRGQDALKEITMAKLLAAETYVKTTNFGMQVMGGFGYNMEFDMQRHFRDARAATIAAGSFADAAQSDCRPNGLQGAITNCGTGPWPLRRAHSAARHNPRRHAVPLAARSASTEAIRQEMVLEATALAE